MGKSGLFYSVSEYYPVLGSFAHCQVCISSWYISVCSFFLLYLCRYGKLPQ